MGIYLVTGGAGFIGSTIAEHLLRAGEQVRILDDFSSGRRSNIDAIRQLPGKLEVTEGSILDGETVARLMKGVEVVFHQAAIPSVARSVENPQASVAAGVQGTTVVLDCARQAGVRRVIYAGSSSVYGNTPTLPKVETMTPAPLSPYAVSKLGGEHMMRVFAGIYGIETLTLRYFNVFGPRQDPGSAYAAVIPKFIQAALDGTRPVIFGDGKQTRDFCYIENTVRANLAAAMTSNKLSGEAVNVACGDRTSLLELADTIGDIVGKKLELEHKADRPGDVRDSLADIEAAARLIGYEPRVRIREGLERTVEAMRGALTAAA